MPTAIVCVDTTRKPRPARLGSQASSLHSVSRDRLPVIDAVAGPRQLLLLASARLGALRAARARAALAEVAAHAPRRLCARSVLAGVQRTLRSAAARGAERLVAPPDQRRVPSGE